MGNCRFAGLTKHGRLAFVGGTVYGFEDDKADEYFVAVGWGTATDDPADVIIGAGDLTVDPFTVFADGANRGQFVLPVFAAEAAEALGMTADEARSRVLSGEQLFSEG